MKNIHSPAFQKIHLTKNKSTLAKTAFGFVLIIGIVNLFADVTYEGARSITGPFLGSLGASATVIGLVAGTGELLGYSLRSVAGYMNTERSVLSSTCRKQGLILTRHEISK